MRYKVKTVLSLDTVKNIFSSYGCEYLEKEHKRVTIPIKFRCRCGKIETMSVWSFQQYYHGCYDCHNKMKKEKLEAEYKKKFVKLNKLFSDAGFTLLSKVYTGSSQQLSYKCNSCKTINCCRIDKFVIGRKCKGCGKRYLSTCDNETKINKEQTDSFINEINVIFENDIIPEINKHFNDDSKIDYKLSLLSKAYTLEDIRKYFESKNMKLLTTDYINIYQKLKYKCTCGKIREKTFKAFQKRPICNCNVIRRYGQEYVKDFYKMCGCELLEKKYKDLNTKMKSRCSCGKIEITSFRNFKNRFKDNVYKCVHHGSKI